MHIFTKNMDDHLHHMEIVPELLQTNTLFAKEFTWIFTKSELEYLGHIINEDVVKVYPTKNQAILDWPTSKNVT